MTDIETVDEICPKTKIFFYFTQFSEQGWIAVLDVVINDLENDSSVLSVSRGFAENTILSGRDRLYNKLMNL